MSTHTHTHTCTLFQASIWTWTRSVLWWPSGSTQCAGLLICEMRHLALHDSQPATVASIKSPGYLITSVEQMMSDLHSHTHFMVCNYTQIRSSIHHRPHAWLTSIYFYTLLQYDDMLFVDFLWAHTGHLKHWAGTPIEQADIRIVRLCVVTLSNRRD